MSGVASDGGDQVSSVVESKEEEAMRETQNHEEEEEEEKQEGIKDCMHKTKAIQFLGRTTPIILQNDNGPCPLLAICNVLLLRNNLNLSPDVAEVSQEKLLSLVAEQLIDSNSTVNNKDAGFVENQQQNISDAIDLLPRLATGIDVNIKFKRIDDFEFTPECAIFDLLDIPLYHGWIVDPQDNETAAAISSKSYNAIMEELVALETRNMEVSHKNSSEDCVDFAAATAATLGVPSPNLSKTRSFNESPRSTSDQQIFRKGDLEEEAELLRVLKLSEAGDSASVCGSGSLDENSCSENLGSVDAQEGDSGAANKNRHRHEPSFSDNCTSLSNGSSGKSCSETLRWEEFPRIDGTNQNSSYVKSGEVTLSDDAVEKKNNVEKMVNGSSADDLLQSEGVVPISVANDTATIDGNNVGISQGGEKIKIQSSSASDAHDIPDNVNGRDSMEVSSISLQKAGSDSSSDRIHNVDLPEAFSSSLDGSEPIYEGEECILDSVTAYENQEPVYEGEVVLAKQSDNFVVEGCNAKEEITPKQGELITNFLKNNANQLTFYGLFCLQDGLKERELCVFFRNNHFSTMFKYDGELYLLATDQGYLNEPDLVWEKLNEVNGDTLFMTGNFREFKVDSDATRTDDYIDGSAHAGSDEISDLQLALALQQEEYEQQPQRQNVQQPPVVGASRLVTGPKVSRNSGRGSSSSRQETKSKEKCIVM
ncbi:hypothetical protein V6N13_026306 [Hibiscus sabdariffa]|uniref:MINDY deubiquitinase domain-containing protein n=2 Tax=Hibiscus sabdariffa TaxID=183260 RepID=A0ABR2APR4_9ROSI